MLYYRFEKQKCRRDTKTVFKEKKMLDRYCIQPKLSILQHSKSDSWSLKSGWSFSSGFSETPFRRFALDVSVHKSLHHFCLAFLCGWILSSRRVKFWNLPSKLFCAYSITLLITPFGHPATTLHSRNRACPPRSFKLNQAEWLDKRSVGSNQVTSQVHHRPPNVLTNPTTR